MAKLAALFEFWYQAQSEIEPYRIDTRQDEMTVSREIAMKNARNILNWRIRLAHYQFKIEISRIET